MKLLNVVVHWLIVVGVCLYSVFLTSDLEKWLEAMLLSNRKEYIDR